MVDSLRRIMCSCGNVDVSLLVFRKVKGSASVGAEAGPLQSASYPASIVA